ELVLVEKIEIGMLMADEQPVAAFRADCPALLQKCTEWRYSRAGPNHDDRHGGISRQTKGGSLLHVDLERTSRWQAFSEMSRSDTQALAVTDVISHRSASERETPGVGLWRRRNRVEARLQRVQCLDERLGVWPDGRKFLDRREHIEHGGIAVRIFAGRQRPRLFSPVATGNVGKQLKQHVGRRGQRYAVGQNFPQRTATDRKFRRRIESLDDRLDQQRIVGGKKPKCIS